MDKYKISILMILLNLLVSAPGLPAPPADPFIDRLLKDTGVSLKNTPPEIPGNYAMTIIDNLLSIQEWLELGSLGAKTGGYDQTLFDYGDRGKSLSLQRNFDMRMKTTSNLMVLIERPSGIRLRHKIEIGTDKAKWEMIRKESTWPEDKPFKRVYLHVQLRGENGRMKGSVYFEGVRAEIQYRGFVDDEKIKTLEKLTWQAAERLEKIYDKEIKPISEGPIFKDAPVLDRPDLPDPDIQ